MLRDASYRTPILKTLVVGVGDFFESGVDDVLFRNNSTGDTWIEAITNGASAGWDRIGGSDTHYSVVGVGDFFGNGTDDILFRNNSTGDTWFEAISNGAFAGWNQIGGSDTPIPSWALGTTSATIRRTFCSATAPGILGLSRSPMAPLPSGPTSAAPAPPTACPSRWGRPH
jgi:hypothetical protein